MDVARVDLKKLKSFYLTAKHGSLQSAASRLRITTAAVSIQISNLERQVGIALFDRAPNKLILTEAGNRFLAEVEAIFSAVERAFGSLSSPKPAGSLSVSMGNDLSRYFAPKMIKFMQSYPDVDFSLSIHQSPDVLSKVQDGIVEIGIGYFKKVPPAISKVTIMKSSFSLVCCANHPLSHRSSVSLQDIARYKVLRLPSQGATGQLIDREFAKAGIKPKSMIELGNCQTARDFAERETGVAIVHSVCMRSDREESRCHHIDLEHIFGMVDLAAIYQKRRPISLLHRAFIEIIST